MLADRLSEDLNFNQIFEVVKKAVEKTLRKHRAGLTLILAELPNFIGAYHISGSNLIVMNRTLLDQINSLAKSREEFNAFIFSILTHEYLHSLGYMSEETVRSLVRRISEDNLGGDHPATRMAEGDIISIYPELRHLGAGRFGRDFTVVKEFDTSSMPYIG